MKMCLDQKIVEVVPVPSPDGVKFRIIGTEEIHAWEAFAPVHNRQRPTECRYESVHGVMLSVKASVSATQTITKI